MVKKTIKNIFEQAVDRAALPERDNYTFRLDMTLYKQFKKICEDKRVTASNVIEEFIKEVVKEET